MRRARHDLYVNGWILVLQAHLGEAVHRIRGPRNSYVEPPEHTRDGQRRPVGPDELQLPGWGSPHGFLRTDRAHQRVAVEQFAAIEPDAAVELAPPRWPAHRGHRPLRRTGPHFKPANKIDTFERYDHVIKRLVPTEGPLRQALHFPVLALRHGLT
jgi:hypothetical protein